MDLARPGEQVAAGLVQADRAHPRVVVEGGLHAVAVVGVQVDVQHPQRPGPGAAGDGHGDVVDQAEPDRAAPLGVVQAGHGREHVGQVAGRDRVQRGHGRPRDQPGRLVHARERPVVADQPEPGRLRRVGRRRPGGREAGQRLQVVAVVDQLQVGVGGRGEPQQVGRRPAPRPPAAATGRRPAGRPGRGGRGRSRRRPAARRRRARRRRSPARSGSGRPGPVAGKPAATRAATTGAALMVPARRTTPRVPGSGPGSVTTVSRLTPSSPTTVMARPRAPGTSGRTRVIRLDGSPPPSSRRSTENRSDSVRMPTSPSSATTGRQPMALSTSSRAATSTGSSGQTVTGWWT